MGMITTRSRCQGQRKAHAWLQQEAGVRAKGRPRRGYSKKQVSGLKEGPGVVTTRSR